MIKGNILVVDDEEGMRVTLKKILNNRGYAVTTAADFDEASYYLQERDFDAIITDIVLYDINGLELLRIIKEKALDIPAIMITGEPNVKTAIESVRLGAYEYLIKPITKNNLPPIVDKAVEKKRILQEKRRLEKENAELRRNLEKTVTLKAHLYQNRLLYYSQLLLAEIIENKFSHSMKKKLPKGKVDPTLILENTLDSLFIPQNISIEKEFPDEAFSFFINEVVIQYIFFNLIENAILAMHDGGKLLINIKKADNYLKIHFKDQGAGIKEENYKKIFQPFYTTRESRNGLGLAICKYFIEKEQGSISFLSSEGKGSEFILRLPLYIETEQRN